MLQIIYIQVGQPVIEQDGLYHRPSFDLVERVRPSHRLFRRPAHSHQHLVNTRTEARIRTGNDHPRISNWNDCTSAQQPHSCAAQVENVISNLRPVSAAVARTSPPTANTSLCITPRGRLLTFAPLLGLVL